MVRPTKSVYEAILDQLEKEAGAFPDSRRHNDSTLLLVRISSSCHSLLSVIMEMSIPSAVRPQFMDRLRSIYGEHHSKMTTSVGGRFMTTIAALTLDE